MTAAQASGAPSGIYAAIEGSIYELVMRGNMTLGPLSFCHPTHRSAWVNNARLRALSTLGRNQRPLNLGTVVQRLQTDVGCSLYRLGGGGETNRGQHRSHPSNQA